MQRQLSRVAEFGCLDTGATGTNGALVPDMRRADLGCAVCKGHLDLADSQISWMPPGRGGVPVVFRSLSTAIAGPRAIAPMLRHTVPPHAPAWAI